MSDVRPAGVVIADRQARPKQDSFSIRLPSCFADACRAMQQEQQQQQKNQCNVVVGSGAIRYWTLD